MSLVIHPVTTLAECRQIEDLQVKIWNTPPLDVVPDHILLTIAKNGGVVLLAELDDRPVGFVYSFQGQTPSGERKHCSHQAGVLPNLQRGGIGYRLKLAQREAVLAQGIELVTWTFDPLISLNANLNLGKLGATSRTYHRNLYGQMRAGINVGLESDRLEVEWRLNSPRVRAKIERAAPPIPFDPAQVLNPAVAGPSGFPAPPDAVRPLTEARHFMQIPPDIDAIKRADLPLAIAWRAQTRALFEAAIAAGYTIADFVRRKAQDESYYVFELGDGV